MNPPADPARRKSVVMLVDNKRRDLMVAALIAHQLERHQIDCHLEPLQAWQGALAAHRPDLILFNHLTAAHLVKYSQRLASMGVLTAVLPNEGILYDLDVLAYNAGKHHNGAHIDLFFCWNDVHKQALQKCGFTKTQIEVVGVPRFDFYFPPWSNALTPPAVPHSSRPRVLFCTNFVFAKFKDLPVDHVDRFFGRWKSIVPSYADYWGMIEANHRARTRMFDFLNVLVGRNQYQVVLRPHPSEDATVYRAWMEALPAEQRTHVHFDPESNITSLILSCQLEISCETCTTALESWIAGKPAIELVLERHPVFFHPHIAALADTSERPEDLVALVGRLLAGTPPSADKQRGREQHLQQWCHAPDGTSSAKLAAAIAARLAQTPGPDWSQLDAADRRRGLKLRVTQKMGQPYHFDPLLSVKSLFGRRRYAKKRFTYQKAIRPSDVRTARALLHQQEIK